MTLKNNDCMDSFSAVCRGIQTHLFLVSAPSTLWLNASCALWYHRKCSSTCAVLLSSADLTSGTHQSVSSSYCLLLISRQVRTSRYPLLDCWKDRGDGWHHTDGRAARNVHHHCHHRPHDPRYTCSTHFVLRHHKEKPRRLHHGHTAGSHHGLWDVIQVSKRLSGSEQLALIGILLKKLPLSFLANI